MKKYLPFIPGIFIGALLSIGTIAYAATPVTFPVNGGTGSTTLSGILIGNGKSPVNTVIIGSNLSLTGTTLSATGGGGTPGGSSGQLQYNGAGTFQGVSTTTVSCSGNTSCTSFTAIGPSPITITSSGGGTNFWTSSGGNIYNNTGAQVQAPSFAATSTTATSTFAGSVLVGTAGNYGFSTGNLSIPNLGTTTVLQLNPEMPIPFINSLGQVSTDPKYFYYDPVNHTVFINAQDTASANAGTFLECFHDCDITEITGNNDIGFPVGTLTAQRGTYTIPTNNLTGDVLGETRFVGVTNSASTLTFKALAAVRGTAVGATAQHLGGQLDFETSPDGDTTSGTSSPLTRMTITNAGNVGIGTTTPLGLLDIHGQSANALAIGYTGTTTLALQVNDNAANSGNGLSITTSAAGSGVAIQTVSANVNENVQLLSKAGGSAALLSNGGQTGITSSNAQVNFNVSNSSKGNVASTGWTLSNGAAFNTVLPRLNFTDSGAPTALTTTLEMNDMLFSAAGIKTHATGAIAQERTFRFTPQTENFATGSSANNTIASSTSLSIDSGPLQGTLANFTNNQDLFLGGGGYTSSTTNAYGLVIQTPTGATNNYAASTTGRVVATNLGTGAGAGSLCQAATGEILFDSGANCIVSSLRFKNVDATITPEESLSTVMQLSPIFFHYKQGYGDNGKQQQEGFGAEDVALVDKDLVQYDAQGNPYSVFYQNITAKLVGAVQAIIERLDGQQQEIDQLKAQNAQMQKEIDALQRPTPKKL